MNPDNESLTSEEAARVVRREPALQPEPAAPETDDKGLDDDATTPDRAVSDAE